MRASVSDKLRAPTLLPEFCGLPVLFALLLLAAMVALIMWLAPGNTLTLRGFSLSMLFAVWLALINGVCLCKLRPYLQQLSVAFAYAAIWVLMVLLVLLASIAVVWLDNRLGTALTPVDDMNFLVGNLSIAALMAAALLRYFYVLAQWQERMQAAAQAQVEALQARIRPHFLFNSMNTVAALVRLDPDAAEQTVENLSELFRAALGADDRPATLGEELDMIDRYLAIEQLRLGARLKVRRALESAPTDMRMPRLLLQPLVENAVYHGIQGRREGGEVSIVARRDDGMLEIIIENPLPTTPAPSGHGHAQNNVRHRIAYHFGARGSLDAGVVEERYRVCVRIPLEQQA